MWGISFISESDFRKHVKETIKKYGDKLEPYSIKKFNSNIVDPVKLIFDKTVYQTSWEEIINNEIFRQRDKSNNNDIGYAFFEQLSKNASKREKLKFVNDKINKNYDLNTYLLDKEEIIKKIYNIILKNSPDLCFCLHEDEFIYVTQDNEITALEAESNHQTKVLINDIEDLAGKKFMKILLVGEHEKLKHAAEILKQSEISNSIKTMFSLDMLLEVLPADSDKSVALKWLSGYLNIPLTSVLAVGDAENDIEMLKTAGYSVAMQNAYEQVKKNADYITEKNNDENGLTEALEKFLEL